MYVHVIVNRAIEIEFINSGFVAIRHLAGKYHRSTLLCCVLTRLAGKYHRQR